MLELGEYYQQIVALRGYHQLFTMPGLCTSFAATGDATENGETIIGQNIDWIPDFPVDLLRVKPKKGFEALTLVFGGILEWNLTAAGLGIAMNLILTPYEQQRINVPCSFVASKAMRQKNIGDAIGVIAGYGRGILNYVLASHEGDIVQIETTPDDFNILYPENDFLVHSNHYLTDRFRKGEIIYAIGAADSYVRAHRLKRLMSKHYGKLSVDIMKKLLTDHNNFPSAICRHVDESYPVHMRYETLVSVIMLPKEKVLYATYGKPCEYEYVEYKL